MAISFTIRVAGEIIDVACVYADTREFCRQYMTTEKAGLAVQVTMADIASERIRAARQDTAVYTDAYLETLALYRKIANVLVPKHVLLFHGSAIAVDGEAYLFTAKSGTGKSTHSQLWQQWFGKRAVMVNDDKPLLRITQGGIIVYGTPWDGKHHRSSNSQYPLKAICILRRGSVNHIAPISKKAALPMLCQQCYRPDAPLLLQQTLALVDCLGSRVSLYALACNREPQAAWIAYEGMQP